MSIPARVHFCWIGTSLPWAYVFAILSAAARSGLPEIVLHHTDALDDAPELQALKQAAGVQFDRIDPVACLTDAGQDLGIGDGLLALYRSLESPVKRTDILRAAILYRQGGIYLDMDTVTTASLRPLLDAVQFVGCEYIVWPHSVRSSRSPLRWARALSLDLLRKVLRRTARGWERFRWVERFYYRGINNAVMGATPGARLFADYLRAMPALSAERLKDAYALGPDLLQAMVDTYPHDDLTVHDPRVFYPLPPEISEHWFRMTDNVRLAKVLSPETRLVHWYASVRTKSRVALITPDYVRQHREHQLYSALVCSSCPDIQISSGMP